MGKYRESIGEIGSAIGGMTGDFIATSLTTPLLAKGISKSKEIIGKYKNNKDFSSVKTYPNLTKDENKFLNNYKGKEIPGEITSKYDDINKYQYNATTNYYIKLPEGIPKYKGPVGYQGGSFLGGLDQEQYFIPNSWKYGEIINSYPVK